MSSVSFAFGCNPPQQHLFSQVEATDDMVTGRATWYASTCRECPAGCGILAKNREGRVVKLEGNPNHPINRGKICMRGQAALQGIYNPDRLQTPLLKTKDGWRAISFSKAYELFKSKADEASQKGSDQVQMLTEVVGESQLNLFTSALKTWNSRGPLVFEPFAYESLKTANEMIFGLPGLASYRLDEAEVLVSFGADFLDTWLSPVEYAWKFKSMHALNNGAKNLFCHISPFQSLTAANADHWLACKPGSEAIVALGLVRQALDIRKGRNLPTAMRKALLKATKPYTQDRVLNESGIALPLYEKLIIQLMGSDNPLILGTGTAASDPNSLQTDIAVNLLNWILDPKLRLLDFKQRHRVEIASPRSRVLEVFKALDSNAPGVFILNNVNPVYSLPSSTNIKETLEGTDAFVVSFSNFMDETSELADLIFPVRLPLETWDEYGGWQNINSTLQPAMGRLTRAPHLGDIFVKSAFESEGQADNYKTYLFQQFVSTKAVNDEVDWTRALQQGGGAFKPAAAPIELNKKAAPAMVAEAIADTAVPQDSDLVLLAASSIRFYDGRGANKPWLCEIPDPLSRVAWQTPVLVHPDTADKASISQEDIIRIKTADAGIEAPAYVTELVSPNVLVMGLGQGHQSFGRYAENVGLNPVELLTVDTDPESGAPSYAAIGVTIQKTGRTMPLAKTYGSRTQHGRTFALSISLEDLNSGKPQKRSGLIMGDFPLTLPLPEGYDPSRDFYPPHDHATYRWGMVVDLDKCIGCGACASACYAENNVGIVGVDRVIEGRQMGWLSIERYHDEQHPEKVTFLPMLCQHCDNAPCETVCPVYAPHHSKEGLNNQIYNRCIGTRFCVQNCPYKVRRFNWFDWKYPKPMNLQLNPDVTVRSKGVMEKCSFCVQRIKVAHTNAKNEKRMIKDGEVVPACVQTCPTDALVFGSLMDKQSRVRKLVDDPRAYQVMGYLNTKPAVIYLKKVVQNI